MSQHTKPFKCAMGHDVEPQLPSSWEMIRAEPEVSRSRRCMVRCGGCGGLVEVPPEAMPWRPRYLSARP